MVSIINASYENISVGGVVSWAMASRFERWLAIFFSMINIRQTGSSKALIASMQSINSRLIPYATSSALTACAVDAKAEIVKKMSAVFDRPTRYTLNSLFIEPANKNKLVARVKIKEQSRSESFLTPEVFGGTRNEKGFEKSLRYAGILPAGYKAIQSVRADVDAYGNIPGPTIRKMINDLKGRKNTPDRRKKTGDKRRLAGKKAGFFYLKTKKTMGIFKRNGGELLPVFIFTNRAVNYKKKLDFHAISEDVVLRKFDAHFTEALNKLIG